MIFIFILIKVHVITSGAFICKIYQQRNSLFSASAQWGYNETESTTESISVSLSDTVRLCLDATGILSRVTGRSSCRPTVGAPRGNMRFPGTFDSCAKTQIPSECLHAYIFISHLVLSTLLSFNHIDIHYFSYE